MELNLAEKTVHLNADTPVSAPTLTCAEPVNMQAANVLPVPEADDYNESSAKSEENFSLHINKSLCKGALAYGVSLELLMLSGVLVLFSSLPWLEINQSPHLRLSVLLIYSAMTFLGVFFATLRILMTKRDSVIRFSLPVSAEVAFEACLLSLPHKSIQRIDEQANEIEAWTTSHERSTFKVVQTGPSTSAVCVSRAIEIREYWLFWKKDARYFLEQRSLMLVAHINKICRDIEKNATLFANDKAPDMVQRHLCVNRARPPQSLMSDIAFSAVIFAFLWLLVAFATFNDACEYYAKKAPEFAVQLCNLPLALAHSDRALDNRGSSYLRLNKLTDAEQDFRRVKKSLSDGLMCVLIRQGRFDEAESELNKAEASFRDDPSLSAKRLRYRLAVLNSGRAWLKTFEGQPDAAIVLANEAIRLRPDYSSAYAARGLAFHRLSHEDHAIADYLTAVHMNEDGALAHQLLSRAYDNVGEHQLARDEHRAAAKLDFVSIFPPGFDEYGDPLKRAHQTK